MRIKLIIVLLLAGSLVIAAPRVTIGPSPVKQGQVFYLKVREPDAVNNIKIRFLNREYSAYSLGDDCYEAIIGVAIDQGPGKYPAAVIITKNNNPAQVIDKTILVAQNKFPCSKFWLKPARDKLRARQIIDNEWAEIEKCLLVEGQQRFWQGSFLLPVNERISQGFGHRQIINNKSSGNHRGVDIAVDMNMPVHAAAKGKVVFAKKLNAFGGTVVLDHGNGVHSLYFHLNKFMANIGDMVEQGATIALSGNSGVSSGPHLHWGMSVHNLRVDPMQWITNI